MKLKKQTGSVLVEAAFIIPIVVLSVILTIDAISYGADRITLNNFVMAQHGTWKRLADEVGKKSTPEKPFKCEGGVGSDVIFDGTQDAELAKLFGKAIFNEDGTTASKITVSHVKASDGVPGAGAILDKTYTFKITYPFDGLILPKIQIGTFMMFTLDVTC